MITNGHKSINSMPNSQFLFSNVYYRHWSLGWKKNYNFFMKNILINNVWLTWSKMVIFFLRTLYQSHFFQKHFFLCRELFFNVISRDHFFVFVKKISESYFILIWNLVVIFSLFSSHFHQISPKLFIISKNPENVLRIW